MSSSKLKNDSKNTIINWYKKQNSIGKSKNEKLGWLKKRGFRDRYKVMAGIIRDKKECKSISILDFGCGFSHLYNLELKNFKSQINYTGIDAIKSHINFCKKKYPQNRYFLGTLENFSKKKKFDYIFANGVFTVKRGVSNKKMINYTYENLFQLFNLCKIGLAVNFMSTNVDWKRSDLFHLSMDNLVRFVTKKLSRNFIIRNDYNLYEYTIYIFKRNKIL